MENKYVIGILCVLLVVVGIFAVVGALKPSQENLDTAVKNAVDANDEKWSGLFAKQDKEHSTDVQALNDNIESLTAEKLAVENEKLAVENEKSDLEKENTELKQKIEQLQYDVEDTDVTAYFLLNDVGLTDDFSTTIDPDDFDGLVADDFSYNGNRYDFEENIYLSEDFKPFLNVDDFDGDITVGIENDGAITYMIEFDDKVKLDDDDLEINFLGEPINLVSFDGDKLEYRTSNLFSGKTGSDFTYKEYGIKVIGIDSDNDKVMFDVNGVERTISEKGTRTINGLEIYVDEIFLDNVIFYAGDEIVEDISDGDEYAPNDDWNWVINGDDDGLESIGITLAKTLADDDEVLAEGDSISLPNDYVTFTFDKVKNMDMRNVELKVSNTKLKVFFDDVIEIDGDKIDDGTFTVDLNNKEYNYKYKGESKTGTDFNLIKLYADDRKLDFKMSQLNQPTKVVTISDTSNNYRFKFKDGDFISSDRDSKEMNDNENFRMDNGDLLYKSDVNEENGDKNVKIGLVGDDDVEVVLKVE